MRRQLCLQCLRSVSTCYCQDVQPIQTKIRFVILQHPSERRKTVGTARMAHLGLTDSLLVVGTELDDHLAVRSLIEDSANHCVVLYPGAESQDVSSSSWLPAGRRPVVFVIDGTWSCAKTLLKSNPKIAALPRISFMLTGRLSEYQFRRQPAPHCLSTIEAIHQLIRLVEPERNADRLLNPFRNLVAKQLSFTAALKA